MKAMKRIKGRRAQRIKINIQEKVIALDAQRFESEAELTRNPIIRHRAGNTGRIYVGSLDCDRVKKHTTNTDQIRISTPNLPFSSFSFLKRMMDVTACGRKADQGKKPTIRAKGKYRTDPLWPCMGFKNRPILCLKRKTSIRSPPVFAAAKMYQGRTINKNKRIPRG